MLKLLYHAWGAMLEVQEGSHGGTVVCSNNNIMYCHKCQLSKLITHSWRQLYYTSDEMVQEFNNSQHTQSEC